MASRVTLMPLWVTQEAVEVTSGAPGATLARASATSMARKATQSDATATSAAPESTLARTSATSMPGKATQGAVNETQGAPSRPSMAINVEPGGRTLPLAVLDRPPMPVAALLLVACAQPGAALPLAFLSALASDDNGPPPGSPYPIRTSASSLQ